MPRKKADDTFRFTVALQSWKTGIISYGIEFPHSVKEVFGTNGRVRFTGTINGVYIEQALMPAGKGIHIISIGGELRRKLKVRTGDLLTLEITKDTRPADFVELPEELTAALDLEPEIQKKFEALTPGYKRSLVYWINSGKSIDTRIKRSLE
ncbi:MAG: YdeI/OmpD-associated family protein, partial [Bacteroidia bacterium]